MAPADRSITSETDQRRLEKSRSAKEYRRERDWENCVKKDYVRRVLAEILSKTHLMSDIPPGSAESHALLGARRVGLFMNRRLSAIDPRLTASIAEELRIADEEDDRYAPKPAEDD